MREVRFRTFSTAEDMMNRPLPSEKPEDLLLDGGRRSRSLGFRVWSRRWRRTMIVNLLDYLVDQRLRLRFRVVRVVRHDWSKWKKIWRRRRRRIKEVDGETRVLERVEGIWKETKMEATVTLGHLLMGLPMRKQIDGNRGGKRYGVSWRRWKKLTVLKGDVWESSRHGGKIGGHVASNRMRSALDGLDSIKGR